VVNPVIERSERAEEATGGKHPTPDPDVSSTASAIDKFAVGCRGKLQMLRKKKSLDDERAQQSQ